MKSIVYFDIVPVIQSVKSMGGTSTRTGLDAAMLIAALCLIVSGIFSLGFDKHDGVPPFRKSLGWAVGHSCACVLGLMAVFYVCGWSCIEDTKSYSIISGSPAENFGLRSGDEIQYINSHDATSVVKIQTAMEAVLKENHITIEVLRAGQLKSFTSANPSLLNLREFGIAAIERSHPLGFIGALQATAHTVNLAFEGILSPSPQRRELFSSRNELIGRALMFSIPLVFYCAGILFVVFGIKAKLSGSLKNAAERKAFNFSGGIPAPTFLGLLFLGILAASDFSVFRRPDPKLAAIMAAYHLNECEKPLRANDTIKRAGLTEQEAIAKCQQASIASKLS